MEDKIVYDFKSAIDFIDKRKFLGMNFQKNRIVHILELLDNPHEKCRFIHVAGTNGKGSTISFLSNMFQANGLNVGVFTSPYMHTFLDHFKYNNVQISEDDFTKIMSEVAPIILELDKTEENKGATEFEIATVVMFMYFKQLNPDIVIVEVGLGGLLDSTNILDSQISIITSIGIDHTKILGSTLKEIATHKAGIIKENKTCILGEIEEEPLNAILNIANEKHNEIIEFNKDYNYFDVKSDSLSYKFSYKGLGIIIEDIVISMLGIHQVKNASLAISAYISYCIKNSIEIDKNKIKVGLLKTNWNGRLEIVSKSPFIILDGAHNVQAMDALLNVIKEHFSNYKVTYLYTSLENKDNDKMIPMIDKIPNIDLVLTEFNYVGLDTAENLSTKSTKKRQIRLDYVNVINEFIENSKEDEILLIGGSLYFISFIRNELISKMLPK